MTSAMVGDRFRRSRPPGSDDRDADLLPMQQAPHYYGGQAVLEGVMMRGADRWAVAIRRPDQDIWLEQHPVDGFHRRHPIVRKPLLRGVYALVDSIRIGMKALGIAADQALSDQDGSSDGGAVQGIAIGGAAVVALVLFVGVFIVLPTTGVSAADRWLLGGNLGGGALFHFVESLARIVIFLGYLLAVSMIKDIRRVFEYHGAEHKTISAWEHGDLLAPESVDRHSTLHVRCGTNFLILVMFLALIVYTLAGVVVAAPVGSLPAAVGYHVALRVVLLPVVAGLAYETLRLGAEKNDWAWVRALMQPGLWLQKITTRPPDDGQLEVAIRAFEAVVPEDALGDRVVQDALPSRVVGPEPAPPDDGDHAPSPAGAPDAAEVR